jgi:hypothetical protein
LIQIKGAVQSKSFVDDTFIRTNSSNLFGTNFEFIKRKQSIFKKKDSEARYSLLRTITNLDEQI